MKSIFLFFVALFFCALSGTAQVWEYARLLTYPTSGYYQRSARFANGDLLTGDLSLTPISDGPQNEIFLLRTDECGETIWAKYYDFAGQFHSFDQIKINADDEIFIFGSVNIGGKEVIYILKLNENGEKIRYRRFDGAGYDNLTFSLDYRQERVMLAGALLDFADQGFSYLALLDDDLSLLWCKEYIQNPGTGESVMTDDGGFIQQYLNLVVRANADGEVLWAKTLTNFSVSLNTSPACEVQGGFIFAVAESDRSYFFKLDDTGSVAWVSDYFTAKDRLAALRPLTDGNVLAVYNADTENGTRPALLHLTPDGHLYAGYRLATDYDLSTDFIQCAVTDDLRVNLTGNAHTDFTNNLSSADLMLQFSLEELNADSCFLWEEYLETSSNATQITLANFAVEAMPAVLQQDDLDPLTVRPLEPAFTDMCTEESASVLIQRDSLLPCAEDWKVYLPSDDFVWEDRPRGNPTRLESPGFYRALRRDCALTEVYEFNMEQEECPCDLYLPSAFSPDLDGINDCWQIYGLCNYTKIETSVYSRWGTLVFRSAAADFCWEGEYRGRPLPADVYVVTVAYQTTDAEGKETDKLLVRDVSLVR